MKILIVCFLAFTFHKTSAQVEIINLNHSDSADAVVYSWMPNRILIRTNLQVNNLDVKVNKGTISKLKSNEYEWVINNEENAVLTVTNNGKIIVQKTFRIEEMCDPIAGIPGVRDSTVTVSQLLLNPFLRIYYPRCSIKDYYFVTSFSTVIFHNSETLTAESKGSSYSREQIQAMKTLEPGDKIVFDNIKTAVPALPSRALPPFTIKIK